MADSFTAMDGYIDEALNALGGEDSDFIVKVAPDFPGQVLVYCQTCNQGVFRVGVMDLWELIAYAREHFDAHGKASDG
jgi:hypothetical protein